MKKIVAKKVVARCLLDGTLTAKQPLVPIVTVRLLRWKTLHLKLAVSPSTTEIFLGKDWSNMVVELVEWLIMFSWKEDMKRELPEH